MANVSLVESVVKEEERRHKELSQERRVQKDKTESPPPKGSQSKSKIFEKKEKLKIKIMRKPGQRSSGGKAPPKKTCWPPRLYKKEMEDIENRSTETQTENPTTSVKSQTSYTSTSDVQFQVEASTENKSCQAKWVCRNRPPKDCKCKDGFSD